MPLVSFFPIEHCIHNYNMHSLHLVQGNLAKTLYQYPYNSYLVPWELAFSITKIDIERDELKD